MKQTRIAELTFRLDSVLNVLSPINESAAEETLLGGFG